MKPVERPAEGSLGFAAQIEGRARRALGTQDQDEALAVVDDQIALVLDMVDMSRSRQEELRRSLLRDECVVRTDLLHLNQHRFRYREDLVHDRDRHVQRLLHIDEERRRLELHYQERIGMLRERLLSLLHRHDALQGA